MAGKVTFKKRFFVIIAVILAIIAFGAYGLFNMGSDDADHGGKKSDKAIKTETVELEILCAGDVMAHTSQIDAALNAGSKDGQESYDFTGVFSDISSYISDADLAICNLEAPLGGEPYMGYPIFSAPDSLADALKKSGFDIALTSNNHMLDKGLDGLKRTIEVCREAGLKTTGTHLSGEKNYIIEEVKGIKIAIVSYTYETPPSASSRTINGNPMSDETKKYINSYYYGNKDDDLSEMKDAIDEARSQGAQIVIAYMHWGEEYERVANEAQIDTAETVASFGADIIFASHPHVLQNLDYIGDVPVFYSMGNLISNQREETLQNKYTEQGMLAYAKIKIKDGKKEYVTISLLPTWVDKYDNDYRIIPLDKNLSDNSMLQKSGHLSRAEGALQDCIDMYGQEYIRD